MKPWRAERSDEDGFFAPIGEVLKEADAEDMEKTWTDLRYEDISDALEAELEARTARDDKGPADGEGTKQVRQPDHWEAFYQKNKSAFFKDRNYFARDYPELKELPEENVHVAEWGCGAGNSIWPLAEAHAGWTFEAFDCSATAVELVRERAKKEERPVKVYEWDPARLDQPCPLPNAGVNLNLMVFFLSALADTATVERVARAAYESTRPGGLAVVRDYGRGDMTMLRFAGKQGRRVAEQLYQRADGTLTRFYRQPELDALFVAAGWQLVRSGYECRELRNRKTRIKMYRVWVSAVYRRE